MSQPKIYGLIGYPVKHSLSGLMHNALFKALGINAEYKLFEVKPENLRDFLLTDSIGLSGFNITIPHKVKARQILEEKFPEQNSASLEQDLYYVKLSGAINTVKREGEKLKYYNTDSLGFLKSLEEDLDFEPKGKNVLLIGCGGAGRAIIAALSWKNIGIKKIYVNDIDEKAINSTKKHFSNLPVQWQRILDEKIEFISNSQLAQKIKNCQLLINASPVGMENDELSAIDINLLHKNLYVYDIVYNRQTQLVRFANSLGLKVVDGSGMLLYQGAAAFELWTGKKASLEIMREALNEGMKKL